MIISGELFVWIKGSKLFKLDIRPLEHTRLRDGTKHYVARECEDLLRRAGLPLDYCDSTIDAFFDALTSTGVFELRDHIERKEDEDSRFYIESVSPATIAHQTAMIHEWLDEIPKRKPADTRYVMRADGTIIELPRSLTTG